MLDKSPPQKTQRLHY